MQTANRLKLCSDEQLEQMRELKLKKVNIEHVRLEKIEEEIRIRKDSTKEMDK